MSDRIIFYVDCNNFFASCECLERLELKNVPMAVAGAPEDRFGVVVARSGIARQVGVRTMDNLLAVRLSPKERMCES